MYSTLASITAADDFPNFEGPTTGNSSRTQLSFCSENFADLKSPTHDGGFCMLPFRKIPMLGTLEKVAQCLTVGLQRFMKLLIEGARAPIRPPTQIAFTFHLQHVGKSPGMTPLCFPNPP
jgi:hypothetical protein